MSEPTEVWIVRTMRGDLHGWYYVGVEAGNEARRVATERRPDEKITGAKRVKNVEHVKADGFRAVPIGDYWGPLIPD